MYNTFVTCYCINFRIFPEYLPFKRRGNNSFNFTNCFYVIIRDGALFY